jgi:FKBP-type peptidyl-prolyl cis-trans isomerase (trigger factor)
VELEINESVGLRRKGFVRFSVEECEKSRHDAIGMVASRAKLPGFRPGKVPAKLVEERFQDEVSKHFTGILKNLAEKHVSANGDTIGMISNSIESTEVSAPDEEGRRTVAIAFDVDPPEVIAPNWREFSLPTDLLEPSADQEEEKERMRRQVIAINDFIAKTSGFNLPPSKVAATTRYIFNDSIARLIENGVDVDELRKNMDNFVESCEMAAKKQVAIAYVLDAIAEKENIRLDNNTVVRLIQRRLANSGKKSKKSKKQPSWTDGGGGSFIDDFCNVRRAKTLELIRRTLAGEELGEAFAPVNDDSLDRSVSDCIAKRNDTKMVAERKEVDSVVAAVKG